jgi:hypothetical protein
MAERRGFGDFGYRKSTGEYVSALQDMIDGGGAGRSGEEFEGGGILSLLANLLFSPRGSRAVGSLCGRVLVLLRRLRLRVAGRLLLGRL